MYRVQAKSLLSSVAQTLHEDITKVLPTVQCVAHMKWAGTLPRRGGAQRILGERTPCLEGGALFVELCAYPQCCSRGIPARMEETRCSICVHVATCSKHAPLWACVLSVRLSQLSFELRGPGATAQEHNLLLRLLQPLLSCGVDGHELVVLRVEFLAEPRRFRPGLVRAG